MNLGPISCTHGDPLATKLAADRASVKPLGRRMLLR
jgi:hypothetical protein